MSEFQYYAFRAIDAPVSEENLEFMRNQSSRANITAWGFENEYSYGNFRGDPFELLRRGYDFGFHYANFGVRTIYIRLPHGLPDPDAMDPYLDSEVLLFKKDADGPAGTLVIDDPYSDAGTYEDLWEPGSIFEQLIPLRAEILSGDLRPLYLVWLALSENDEEPPIPAGLADLTAVQRALTDLYVMNDHRIAAAARESPPLSGKKSDDAAIAHWLTQQSQATKDAWLTRLLADPSNPIRAEMMKSFQSATGKSSWPTATPSRPIKELAAIEATAAKEAREKAAAVAAAEAAAAKAKKRADFLASIAANPDASLRQIEQLSTKTNRKAYEEIARLLIDLRDALANSPNASLAANHAKSLQSKFPTRTAFLSELRERGLLGE